MLPDDYLIPILRLEPNHGSGVFTVGVDPREAEFVLARGWLRWDGVRYRADLSGCDGRVQGDGRIMICCRVDGELEAQRLYSRYRAGLAAPASQTSEPPVQVRDWWEETG